MELRPETVRDAQFAVKRIGGYDPDAVDEFLDRVAVGVDELQQRLRDAAEREQKLRAQLAETEDSVRRTLVLAQRTADAALDEARVEAERIVAEADERRRELLEEAEGAARRARDEADAIAAEAHARLSAERRAAEAEVAELVAFVARERERLRSTFEAQLAALDETLPVPQPPGAAAAWDGGWDAGAAAQTADVGSSGLPWEVGAEDDGDDAMAALGGYASDRGDEADGEGDEADGDGEPDGDGEAVASDVGWAQAPGEGGVDAPEPWDVDWISGQGPVGAVPAEDLGGDDDTSWGEPAGAGADLLGLLGSPAAPVAPWSGPHAGGDPLGLDDDAEGAPRRPEIAGRGDAQPAGDGDDVDDPFIAELRAAVDDTSPLGPRDDAPDDSPDGSDEDDGSGFWDRQR